MGTHCLYKKRARGELTFAIHAPLALEPRIHAHLVHIVTAEALAIRDILLARLKLHVTNGTLLAIDGFALGIRGLVFDDADLRRRGRLVE